jgi:tetratricopeptide (TPR) repeat protein
MLSLENELKRVRDLVWEGEIDLALKDADRLILEYPQDDRCWGLRSFIYAKLNNVEASLIDNKMAAKCNPANRRHFVGVCVLQLRLRDYSGCLEYSNAGLSSSNPENGTRALDPDSEDLIFLGARALYGLNKFDEAIERLQLIEDPDYEYLNLGDRLMTKKGLKRACTIAIRELRLRAKSDRTK